MIPLSGADAVAILLSLGAIMCLAHVAGLLATRLGQPAVVGEIAVGLTLGALPTVGPATAGMTPVTTFLQGFSGVGIVLFMFLVGMELRPFQPAGVIGRSAVVAAGSVLAPFALGAVVAVWVVAPTDHPTAFVLFFGCTLAATAFPVLARILRDRIAADDPRARIAMLVAAIVDAMSWLLLIGVLTLASTGHDNPVRLLLLTPYAVGLWAIRRLVRRHSARVATTAGGLGLLIAGLTASAAFTEWLGLHAVIGAFAFGVVCGSPVRDALPSSIRLPVEAIMLPPFFVVTGMHADVSAAAAIGLPIALTILAAAVVGKVAGTALGARLAGFDAGLTLELAVLMNTRGLTELVILDIGRQAGLLSSGLYSALILMAMFTTGMTTPALAAVARYERRPRRWILSVLLMIARMNHPQHRPSIKGDLSWQRATRT